MARTGAQPPIAERDEEWLPPEEPSDEKGSPEQGPVTERRVTTVTAPRPAVRDVPAAWSPSPLAVLDEEDFRARVAFAKIERDRLATLQREVMTPGIDYAKVPGTDRHTILKPGCEILNKLAGYRPIYEITRTVGDGTTEPTLHYLVRCVLLDRRGIEIADGWGSANAWEKKYRYRNAERSCPACGQRTIIKGKPEYGGGWLCWAKRGGCGAKFPTGAVEIEEQGVGQVENPDPHDLDNTLVKMGQKRALNAATLHAHAASGLFTQDMDDDPKPRSQEPSSEERPPAKEGEPNRALPQLLTALARKQIIGPDAVADFASDVLGRTIENLSREKLTSEELDLLTQAVKEIE